MNDISIIEFHRRLAVVDHALNQPDEIAVKIERLEVQRNALDNSFGAGAFRDGQTRMAIEKIDIQLADLRAQVDPLNQIWSAIVHMVDYGKIEMGTVQSRQLIAGHQALKQRQEGR